MHRRGSRTPSWCDRMWLRLALVGLCLVLSACSSQEEAPKVVGTDCLDSPNGTVLGPYVSLQRCREAGSLFPTAACRPCQESDASTKKP